MYFEDCGRFALNVRQSIFVPMMDSAYKDTATALAGIKLKEQGILGTRDKLERLKNSVRPVLGIVLTVRSVGSPRVNCGIPLVF